MNLGGGQSGQQLWGQYYGRIKSNGIGMPEGLDFRNTESLGLRLVTMLAEDQLDGEIKLDRTEGSEFRIKFRVAK